MSRARQRALERAVAKQTHWLEQYAVTVKRYAEQFFDTDAEVEDIIQEVWALTWQHALQGGQLNLTWLLRVVDNKARDEGKRSASRARTLNELAIRYPTGPRTLDELERLALHRALGQLAERERHIIALKHWDDCSGGEIAELLGMSQAAVRKCLSRAYAKLRLLLGEEKAGELIES